MALLLCAVTGAWANDVYKITFNGGSNAEFKNGESVTAGTFFSWNSSKHNINSKFNGCTYDGVTYTSGLKMESATSVSWTSAAKSTVTIVQSTWSDKTIKFDGTELAIASASTATGAYIYTLTDVAAGAHSVTRGSGESGVFAIYVEYTGAAKTQLTAPVITYGSETGDVTIGAVTNATKVTYTTDGTEPTAESTEYTAPFTANDGDVIKAIAIGDNESYVNSSVASKQVLLTGITIADPVINQFNGTVVISCTSPNATIEYSTDGGSNWTTYSRAFTLTTDTDIKARASRASCTTSGIADATITAVAANVKTKTIVMGHGAFEGSGKVLTGKSTDVANGYTLTMLTDQDKSWSGREKITISENGETRTSFCGSNGVQCRLDLPDGVKVTQLRLYSYVNNATSDTKCAWKEVNGENLNSTLSLVPMGAFNDVADYKTNPDLRIFPLDNVEGSLTFTNGGLQTCFVMVLDVIEYVSVGTASDRNYATYVPAEKLDFSAADGITAYIATGLNAGGSAVVLEEVDVVDAGTPIIVKTETKGATVNVPVTTAAASDVPDNKLVAGDGTTAGDAGTYYYLQGDLFHLATSGTLQSGKAYLQISGGAARELSIGFADSDVTAIKGVKAVADGEVYNLSGQRVAAPMKGLYIVNGKKVVVK
ncbi:MAG: chitobiase/beta-hexosaminidase C-terminal domain-containing protein [Prevotella sp.]|nr:chitobiase/beta-hexosaminidase C-terminal domain-containing protein [Prevotella sp.]